MISHTPFPLMCSVRDKILWNHHHRWKYRTYCDDYPLSYTTSTNFKQQDEGSKTNLMQVLPSTWHVQVAMSMQCIHDHSSLLVTKDYVGFNNTLSSQIMYPTSCNYCSPVYIIIGVHRLKLLSSKAVENQQKWTKRKKSS